MMQTIRLRLPAVATVLVLGGCVPVPPRPIPLSEVPVASGPACHVTLVRKKQFAGSAPSHFISLDKRAVAVLEVGEYTTFPVSEGRHALAVTWRAGDRILGAGGFGAGAAVLAWSPYAKSAEVDCKPPEDFLFTLTAKGFVMDEHERVELERVERLDGDFVPERNRFVLPGPR